MKQQHKPYVGADTLNMALKNYIMKIIFVKKDGSLREMNCTKNVQYHPEFEKKTDRIKKLPEHLISVVDVDINEWRTINVNTIQSAIFLEPTTANITPALKS